jgi:hypothetical protein
LHFYPLVDAGLIKKGNPERPAPVFLLSCTAVIDHATHHSSKNPARNCQNRAETGYYQ